MPLQCVTPEYKEYCKTHPCPICLSSNTMIDTPKWPIKIKDVKPGMIFCKVNKNGKSMPAFVLKNSKTYVLSLYMLHVIFSDGRELIASPGHLLIDGRKVKDLSIN